MNNKERAELGFRALLYSAQFTQAGDQQDDLTDLLANLMHYCHESGYDFNAALDMAGMHFDAELHPDGFDDFDDSNDPTSLEDVLRAAGNPEDLEVADAIHLITNRPLRNMSQQYHDGAGIFFDQPLARPLWEDDNADE